MKWLLAFATTLCATLTYADVCTTSVDPIAVGEQNGGVYTCVVSFEPGVSSATAEAGYGMYGTAGLPYYNGVSSTDGIIDPATDETGQRYSCVRRRYNTTDGEHYEVATCTPYAACPIMNGCSGTDNDGYPFINPDYCTHYPSGCQPGWTIGAGDGPSNCCNWDSSPILIDIGGDGFELTDAKGGVMFDLANTGKKQLYSWTAAGVQNGWLALDRNHNGMVDSGMELFGTATPQPQSSHPNGYIALSVYDRPENGGNGNGVIDPGDLIYRSLLIWIDSNHDGISQPAELHHLAELGVEEIGLDFKESKWTDQYGNAFRYKSRVKIANKFNDHWSYDVFLRVAH